MSKRPARDQTYRDQSLIFPTHVGEESGRSVTSIDANQSLIHDADNQTNAPLNWTVSAVLWAIFENPMGKIGIILLVLSLLLTLTAAPASLLAWIATLGTVAGVTLIGMGLFSCCVENNQSHYDRSEGVVYEYIGSPKS